MKVISEGNPQWKKRWVGKQVTCPECGRVVELEPTDSPPRFGSKKQVVIICSRCSEKITVEDKK